ncbi:MAG: DUF4147 domain-containing protein [Deltaproteobacteria bacterium]|nr:MAG: DUF4147 domain-containing protein [Deltaproteobacteria bacterium]
MTVREDARSLLEEAFRKAIEAVSPREALKRHLFRKGGKIFLSSGKGDLLDLTPAPGGKFTIISTGKAAPALYSAALSLVGPPDEGLVVAPGGPAEHFPGARFLPGSHPLPTEKSVRAGEEAMRLVSSLREGDSLLYLLSGGSSAMVVAPVEGIPLEEKVLVQKELMKRGASISELNAVRKALSRIKGGGLARFLRTRRAAVCLISDVPGDDLSVVGSGPLHPPSSDPPPLKVAEKYSLLTLLSPATREILRSFSPVRREAFYPPHVVVADNGVAVEAALNFLKGKGLETLRIPGFITGEAREVACDLAERVRIRLRAGGEKPFALVGGGETTVTVRGKGVGGRNQELALSLSILLEGEENVAGLCAGTDGRDGETDAAGAFFDGYLAKSARSRGLDPADFLERNDSHSFMREMGALFVTGPTETNVMDLVIIVGGISGGRR